MERKCELCGEVFEGERESAKYCTPSCRKLAFQKNRISVPKVSVPEVSVPENDVSVLSVPERLEGEAGDIREEKLRELRNTNLPEVSIEEPCKVPSGLKMGQIYLDLEKDLKLDLKKDLGIFAWTPDGIFIRPDITVKQVQNIARLIHAKNGRSTPEFKECL
jgi:hypothetical protein